MDFPGKFRRFRHRGLVALLFCLLTYSAGAQNSDTATIDFEPERVVKGNRFTIQIRTSIPWGNEVLISRPELKGPMVWWAYPYARSWLAETEDGSVARFVEVLGSIRVDAPGFHTIGPFRISSGGRAAQTDSRDIIGLEPDEADLPYPIFTGWRNPPLEVWQGQAVPLVLEGRNFSSLGLADSVTLGSAPHGLLESAPGLGGIVTRPYENEILYDVPMASWIWTQAETGTYRFPNAKLDISGMARSTPGFEVVVKPVPESTLESGAVGRFSLDYEIEDGPYHAGDVVSFRVRVEGEGNINVLNPPVPEMDGAVLVGQGSTSSYIPGPAGYEGWREERYDFQVELAGDLRYTIPAWIWFEPTETGRVRHSVPDANYIRVDAALGNDIDDGVPVLLGSDIVNYSPAEFHWRNSYWFLLGLPGLIFLVVIFLVKRPTRGLSVMMVMGTLPLFLSASNIEPEIAERAAAAASLAENGNLASAEEYFLELLTDIGESPGLLHDLSIVEMELGNSDLAVAYMRRAHRLRPGSSVLKDSLAKIESILGLDDQIPIPLRIPPASVFIFLLISINAAFLVLALLLYRNDGRTIILALSVALILVTSVVSTFVVSGLWNEPSAVVRVEADPLRKIPGPLATDWIQLPAGTAVSIVAWEGEDYLVRTGYGLEGWLPSESLILMIGDAGGF